MILQINVNGKRVKSDNEEIRKRNRTEDEASSSDQQREPVEDDTTEESAPKSKKNTHGADVYVIVDI
jgi:hypothetical protein